MLENAGVGEEWMETGEGGHLGIWLVFAGGDVLGGGDGF